MFNGTEPAEQISISNARTKVKKFNNGKPNTAKKAHYFSRAVLEAILANSANMGIRVYPGHNHGNELDSIIVAVNADGNNVFSTTQTSGIYLSEQPCPTHCPDHNTDFA